MVKPWEMHPYQYVNQNPILFWDPDGKAADWNERQRLRQQSKEAGISNSEFNELTKPTLKQAKVVADAGGLIPGVGIVADGASAGISVLQGDWSGAAWSLLAMIPVVGYMALAKWGNKANDAKKVIETSADGAKALNAAADGTKIVNATNNTGNVISASDDIAKLAEAAHKVQDLSHLTSQARKSVNTLRKRISEHQTKLKEWLANPDKYDHKNILKNAKTKEIRNKIISGRAKHLEKEIKAFSDQVLDLVEKGTK
ncbi:MAG: hypothetical protein GY822_20780 [Deltaproteobacteria bacterium]|nr:hypothetical protein [Deltaproteobacteria bacterium]